MLHPSRWRWSYSLRLLLILVTLPAGWLGWEIHEVRQRKSMMQWIESHGGSVATYVESVWYSDFGTVKIKHTKLRYIASYGSKGEPTVSRIRQWLGDVPLNYIHIPVEVTAQERARIESLFPEADVFQPSPPQPGEGYF